MYIGNIGNVGKHRLKPLLVRDSLRQWRYYAMSKMSGEETTLVLESNISECI